MNLVDTMALIRYLKQDEKLSADASAMFSAGERVEAPTGQEKLQ